MSALLSSFRYLLGRLAPFMAVYILAELLEILFLLIREWENLNFTVLDSGMAVLVWTGTTCISCLFSLVPFLAYLLLLPQRLHGTRGDTICTLIFLFLFTAANLFEEVSSWLFWDEFAARFNFVAVDYLVYTNEVIGNIVQSYPVGILLGGIAGITLLLTFLLRRVAMRAPAALEIPHFKMRATGAALIIGFACILNLVNFIRIADEESNRYLTEISKDGLYSLFHAFFSNELSYEDFYLTLPEDKVLATLSPKLASDAVRVGDPASLSYKVIPTKGAELRMNVVVVLMESMGSEFLSEFRTDGEKLTPELERLAADGLYFSHTYATGTRSVRGIEALTLARPPLPGMSLVRREDNGNLLGIGEILRGKGYETKWIYGGYGYFDNMNAFFAANGYEVVDRSAFDKQDISFSNVWGVCDEDLFHKVVQESDASWKAGKPFFNIILTTSNHRPFSYPDGKVAIPSKTGRRGAVMYADYAVGSFIREARSHPWFDNTVFVFVADHGAGSAGREELRAENHHIPLIVYAPRVIAPQRVDMPISQIDAVPTLLSLLHMPYEGQFPGMNALDPNYVSRYFFSNYQKVAYTRGQETIIMSPVRTVRFYRNNALLGSAQAAAPEERVTAPDEAFQDVLDEGISYYQHADQWRRFLKVKPEQKQSR